MSEQGTQDTGLEVVELPSAENIVNLETEKRGRGRPRKDANAAGDSKPLNFPSPPQKASKPKKDHTALVNAYVMSNFMIAMKMGLPEIAVTDAEALQLVEAWSAVLDHYNIKLSGKHGAVLGAVAATAMVYGPKGMSAYIRVKAQNEAPGQVSAN